MAAPPSIRRVDDTVWELPPTFRAGMHVPVRLFATEELLGQMDEQVFAQAAEVATLPGIVGHSFAMPDAHWGYGFPIGGVAAMDAERARARRKSARHARLGQPLSRDPGGASRGYRRSRPRGPFRDLAAESGGRHVPLREPRLRPPGGDGLPRSLPPRDEDEAPPGDLGAPARVRAVPLARGGELLRRDD